VNYPTREPFVANTDRAWFDFFVTRAIDRRVDEVNFWLPNATSPMKSMLPGEPIFFRLKRPDHCIAGYGGPRSNHIQNGLLLTKEFHALFDQGYVGITPDYEIRVSDRLRADWNNGRRYYPYDRQRLQHVPTSAAFQPSRDALAWHLEHVFKKTG
jgi:hypothetical protein